MRTPAVRLVPAPPLEPPFDDQRDDQRAPEAHLLPPYAGAQLTLQWRSLEPARDAVARSETRRVELSPGATAGASPDAWHATVRFLDRCLEILNGYRPASHIRPLSAPMEAQTIMEQVAAVARRTTSAPRTAQPSSTTSSTMSGARPSPISGTRPSTMSGAGPGGRTGVRPSAVARRRVHVCEPRPGVAEATAVLSQASRSWAVAFRLEQRSATWLCTAFTDVAQQR